MRNIFRVGIILELIYIKNRIIFFLFLLIFNSSSYALEIKSHDSSIQSEYSLVLEDLFRKAEEQNPELLSFYVTWEAVKEKAPQAVVLPDPHFTYGLVMATSDPMGHKFSASQAFPWYGKRDLKEKIAIKEAEAAYQDYIAKRLDLFKQIKLVYFDYYYLGRSIAINKEHLDLFRVMEKIASIRYKVGNVTQSSLVRIQIEQGKIEDRIKELESLKQPLSAKLYALIGKEGGTVLPWPEEIKSEAIIIPENEIRRLIVENNPSLKKISILREKENSSLLLAEKNFYPNITLTAGYDYMLDSKNITSALVSVNLPIWRSSLNAREREVEKRNQALTFSHRDKENQFSSQLDLFLYYYKDSVRKADLYRNTLIPKAEQGIELALSEFESGTSGFLEILEAERVLLEFRLTEAKEIANSYKQRAEMEALTGYEFSRINTEKNKKNGGFNEKN